MKPKVYLFVTGRWGPDYLCLAVAESGHILGQHVCSSPSYMRHDLTETPKRIEALSAHYPCGYEIVEMPDGEAPPDEVFDRNQALAAEEGEES